MPERDKITILVFDCWLPGFTYIRELADYQQSVNLVFVHTSSLQLGQPAREYETFKKQYDVPSWVHDFSRFNYDFKKLFYEVKPDAVLVLSLHAIESRTALVFAAGHGIPTFLIPHGIVCIYDKPPIKHVGKSNISAFSYIISKIPRILYYTRFFWKFHIARMRLSRHRTKIYTAMMAYMELIRSYFYWQWRPGYYVQAYYGSSLDFAILYDDFILDYYKKNYGEIVKGTNFVASGTLDLGRVARQFRSVLRQPRNMERDRVAYYISSPFTEYFTDHNTAIYGDIVRRLMSFVQSAGYHRFIYRPHPGEPWEFTQKVCEIAGAEIDRDHGLTGLAESELICGTCSSLLYCAVILGKLVVIMDSRRLQVDPPYYEPLISYPKILFDADAEDSEAALKALVAAEATRVPVDLSEIRDPLADLVDLIRRQEANPADAKVE